MAEPIIIPEEREPSYLNRHLWTGAKFGLIAALGVGAAFALGGFGAAIIGGELPLALASGTIGLAIGAGSGIGCVKGRAAIEKNITEGRQINPPSLFNEGMGQGILNGAMIGLGAVTITALLTPAAPAVTLAAVAGAAAMGTAFLGYYQGKQHQAQMADDYELAKVKAAEQNRGVLGNFFSKSKVKEVEPAVTREEMEELESKLKSSNGEKHNWRDTVSAGLESLQPGR